MKDDRKEQEISPGGWGGDCLTPDLPIISYIWGSWPPAGIRGGGISEAGVRSLGEFLRTVLSFRKTLYSLPLFFSSSVEANSVGHSPHHSTLLSSPRADLVTEPTNYVHNANIVTTLTAATLVQATTAGCLGYDSGFHTGLPSTPLESSSHRSQDDGFKA